ncbi:hypothetical protein GGX14DRAFT_700706 [Mycena pura]|uniref:Chromatin elongation factor SPT5 n=1 Tax=Mycena pura TaxID=153505 RepID=A0AAD6Y5T0_9AGAR|nr:hypothetical protein GGX14DRAFT_700706 [Mycena pura]
MAAHDNEVFRDRMHELVVEVDEHHYRPGTPPASRSPSPPPNKRRRLANHSKIPKGVLRLLDLEAGEDSGTDDDASDVQDVTGDFIDDEADHDVPISYNPPLRGGDDEGDREDAEFLRGLAASFEERSLRELEVASRELDVADVVPHIPPLTDTSLYTFIVSSHWELRLVDFVAALDGIGLVGTPGPSSRVVFFETSNLAAVANATRKWMWAHRVRFRGPQEVSLFEIAPLLNIPRSIVPSQPGFRLTNCFARLKSGAMQYGSCPVSILSPPALPNQAFSSVLGQSNQPRRLLDVAEIKRDRPDDRLTLSSGGTRCIWGSRVFSLPSGLEILPLSLEYDAVRVRPTDDELELFLASDCLDIDAPFVGPSCALQEGDRVLVVDGSPCLDCAGGKIVAIFERRVGDERVRMAVISRPDALAEFGPRYFVRPVSSLRLHILSWRRAVCMGDRVVVVAGSGFRGYSGRIFDFPTPASMFRRGDIVRVVRGEHKDKLGLVIALHPAGYVEFYVCDSERVNICLRPSFMTARTELSACTEAGTDLDTDEHVTIRVPTHDVVFVPLDNSGFQLPGFSSEWAHRSVQSQREASMALDRIRHKWELDLMRTGRFLTGMFVRIIGKHSRKGQFGMIRDYRRLLPASDGDGLLSQWGDIRKDVRISVQIDASYHVEDLGLENVVERDSGLAVLMALLLKEFRNIQPFEQKPQEPSEPSPPILQMLDLTEAEVRALSGPEDPRVVDRPDIGETTGSWLTHPNLVWKRIDVQVESLPFLYNLAKQPNVGNKVGPKVTKVAGLCGYLRPFGRPVPARETGSFSLRFLARGRDANVPVVALRPLRTTPVPGEVEAVACISAHRCRVVIIGPDVSGDHSRIGDYAETVPGSPPSVTDIVRVRFVWERLSDGTHHQAHADYHLQCLCLSLNQDTPADGPPVTRTDFDKQT